MRMFSLTLALMLSAAVAVAQDQPAGEVDELDIPPADVNIQPPEVEEVPVPAGERDGRLELGRELDLGKLRGQVRPEARRFLHRSGEDGISFGLDMAHRGISFGLRFAHGDANRDDARAFGIEMGRRGREFGLRMRDQSLEAVEDAIDGTEDKLPRDGRDAEFQETPGDITIDAPPIPRGPDASPPATQPKIFRPRVIDREVNFRREF